MIGDDLLKMIDSESSGSHEEEITQAAKPSAHKITNHCLEKPKSSDFFVKQMNEQIIKSESKVPQLTRATFVPEQTFNSIYSHPSHIESSFSQISNGFRQGGYTCFEAPTVMQS